MRLIEDIALEKEIQKFEYRKGIYEGEAINNVPHGNGKIVWESGNFGHGDERFGDRPEGKWKSKWHTWKIVSNKLHLSAVYAPHETWYWLTGLIGFRLKEIILSK